MDIKPIKLASIGSRIDVSSSPTETEESGKTFGQFLTEALGDVNNLQKKADKASIDMAAGKIQDISQVVIATEKASVALQLTMQIRNKIVDAYQEVMRMPI